jgi:hypothetical protein
VPAVCASLTLSCHGPSAHPRSMKMGFGSTPYGDVAAGADGFVGVHRGAPSPWAYGFHIPRIHVTGNIAHAGGEPWARDRPFRF